MSNLVSAHDANASLTVDKYYDVNNEELDYDPLNPIGEDSVWNYHVWNDVWMARPDLPKGMMLNMFSMLAYDSVREQEWDIFAYNYL